MYGSLAVVGLLGWSGCEAPAPAGNAQVKVDAPVELQAAEVQLQPVAEADPAPGEAGMMVFIDPQTGRRVAQPVTAEQKRMAAKADPSVSDSGEGVVIRKHPKGGRVAHLGGRFQHYSTVTIRPDGSMAHVCAEHPDMSGSTVAAAATEE